MKSSKRPRQLRVVCISGGLIGEMELIIVRSLDVVLITRPPFPSFPSSSKSGESVSVSDFPISQQ